MSEITASTLHPLPTDAILYFELHENEIEPLKASVEEFLAANNIDPEKVLFAGYNPAQLKSVGTESWVEGDTPSYFFGDLRSLSNPLQLSDDQDTRDEHWLVNPLRYATKYGVLGVYDKDFLDEHARPESDSDDVREFGTYRYEADPAIIEGAKLASMNLRGNEPAPTLD